MRRAMVFPLAGLLVAAVALRALRPSPAPPPPAAPAAVEPPAVAPEPAPAPSRPEAAPPPSTTFVEPVLTAGELRPLLDARFSDETILAWARVTGRPFRASPEELAALRQAGMSDALLGRLLGAPEPPPPAPEATAVAPPPPVTVYVPVSVTVVDAPPPSAPEPPPYVSTVVLACPLHGRAGCCPVPVLPRPAIYGKPPLFKTREFMPTQRLPGAEEVARREEARAARIRR